MTLPTTVTEDTRPISPCRKFEGHLDSINGIVHLQDGQRMMTCSYDGSLRVWNLQTGKQIANHWRDGESAVNAIASSPDGKKIVSGSSDGAVRLWNIDTGKIIAKWTGHMENVESVCWSRDAERIVTGYLDGIARVWGVESEKTLIEIETGLSRVQSAIYSPDASIIATGGHCNSEEKEYIKIWNATTGKLITHLKGHTAPVYCLCWTPDGTTLISSSCDSSIRTWDTATWQQIAVLTRHTNCVHRISISPNGRILASASYDETAQLWNLETGQSIGEPLRHAHMLNCVSFSTDGKLLATGCIDKNAYTWDISVIVREAGLDALLNDSDKSLLEADATRHPSQRRENTRQLHPGFFDDSPHHPVPSTILPTSSSSSPRHDTPPQSRFPEWARNFNWPRRRNDEGIELQEGRPTVVDVPLGQGNPRYYSASEVRIKKEKENAKNAKDKASASNSRSPQSNVTKQSAGLGVRQPSELHTAASTLSTTPAVAATIAATTSATSLQNAIILRPGCWTRFWLFICCTSARYTDDHH